MPASLIANWRAELGALRAVAARRRRPPVGDAGGGARARDRPRSAGRDVVHHDLRHAAAHRRGWPQRDVALVVLDEAQAIKNPGARQTRAVKALRARVPARAHRHAGREPPRRSVVALRLPQPRPARLAPRRSPRSSSSSASATHGSLRAAARAGAALHPAPAQDRPAGHRRPARQDRGRGLLRPDARSRPRSTQQAVDDAARRARSARRHQAPRHRARLPDAAQADLQPSRRSGSATARCARADSGKFARLRELAEEIAARQEKVLVFTQFREMTEPLARFPRGRLRPARAGAARRHGGRASARELVRALPARRRPAVLRALAEGGRHRAEPDGGHAT